MGIEAQFKKVFLEINNLEKKINNREWSVIFENKHHSFENLMKSSNYHNIYNFTRQIGDDIIERCSNGMISNDESKSYRKERHQVDYELHRIHLMIEELDRNFWKSSKNVLEEFQDKIMLNLPKNPKKTFWKTIKKISSRLMGKKPRYLKEK